MIDLLAAILLAYNCGKIDKVFIIAEAWKQADSSEACHQAKACFVVLHTTIHYKQPVFTRDLCGFKFFVCSCPTQFKPASTGVWEIFPAPTPHTSNLHPPFPAGPTHAHPPFFYPKPTPVWKLLKIHNDWKQVQQAAKSSWSFFPSTTKTFPHIWSSAVKRFEVIKTIFHLSCDQLCIKRCRNYLEGLLDWIMPYHVQRYHWKMEMVTCLPHARVWANVSQQWFVTSCDDCCRM